jgi:predicted nucleotidyltransferase
VLSRLGERIRVEAAIVFGSWARGGGGEWSDVDLRTCGEAEARGIEYVQKTQAGVG